MSYDDVGAISAFAKAHDVSYPLLSDVDSAVIRQYGLLNTQVEPGDVPLYGIPFPGSYVVDEDGVVVAKFFHDSYKKRDSPDNLIDAALGRISLQPEEPRAEGGDETVRVSATLHGGGGVLKQGAMRSVVVRFDLPPGLHVYAEPVPEGMVATSVTVEGVDGIRTGAPVLPPTEPLQLPGVDAELRVWSGTVDIAVPVWPTAPLLSEMQEITEPTTTLDVTVRYQACDDRTCLLPRTEKFSLEARLEPVDLPDLPLHPGSGQRVTKMGSGTQLRRLVIRKLLRTNPLDLLRSVRKQRRLNRAASARAQESAGPDARG
ncbi:MAG: redoxin domain-containing protein [Deltaproteobacteria bacterium]|nr:redoxin domain-containing protein [Deltaproteobacteria bacterium]